MSDGLAASYMVDLSRIKIEPHISHEWLLVASELNFRSSQLEVTIHFLAALILHSSPRQQLVPTQNSKFLEKDSERN